MPDDITATISPGDPPTTVTTNAIGQNAKFTFAGTANQRIAVRISSVSLTGGSPNWATISLKKPDGSSLGSTSVDSSGGFIDTTVLPVSGTYSLVIDPLNMSVGSVTITLYDVPADLTGTISFGSPLNVTINSVGQGASYTFSGTINQRISLNIASVNVTSGGSLTIRIKKPDGTTLALRSVTSSGGYIDLTLLPVAGTYSVAVDPNGLTTGSCTLTLYEVPADVSTSTTVNASAINIANTIPGQNILVTFPGTASQQVTIRVTNNLIGSVFVKLFRPDGTQQMSYSHTSTSFTAPQQTLGTTGTYTILVDPFGNSVNSMNLRVTNP